MKTNSVMLQYFLILFLWLSLASAIVLSILLGIATVNSVFNVDLRFLSAVKINLGDEKLSLADLQAKGIYRFLLMAAFGLYYLWVLARLFWTAIRTIKIVDLQNPFTSDVSVLISRAAALALHLGILNIVVDVVFTLIYHSMLEMEVEFGAFNFFIVAAIFYWVASIFRRGVDLQSQSDLTI